MSSWLHFYGLKWGIIRLFFYSAYLDLWWWLLMTYLLLNYPSFNDFWCSRMFKIHTRLQLIVIDNTAVRFEFPISVWKFSPQVCFMFLLSRATVCECPLPLRICECPDNSVLFGNGIIQIMEVKLAWTEIIKQVFFRRKSKKMLHLSMMLVLKWFSSIQKALNRFQRPNTMKLTPFHFYF